VVRVMDRHVKLAESVVEQHPLRFPATLATADNVAATGRSRPEPDTQRGRTNGSFTRIAVAGGHAPDRPVTTFSTLVLRRPGSAVEWAADTRRCLELHILSPELCDTKSHVLVLDTSCRIIPRFLWDDGQGFPRNRHALHCCVIDGVFSGG
jgi:hypothetical protein